jgi:hypothetical protein
MCIERGDHMDKYSNFDTISFSILLEKAKGDRSINQYANTIGVSAAHISRLLRKLIKAPPAPETINKFSSGAYNGVTYSELMLAAGHINDDTEETSTENKRIQNIENKRKFFQVIMSDLYTRDFDWSLNKTTEGTFDIMLEIINWEYSKWYIQIKSFVNSRTIYNVYGQIACTKIPQDTKISMAVGSKSEFDFFVNTPPKSLCANLYIMLVDLNSGRIIKEEKLC